MRIEILKSIIFLTILTGACIAQQPSPKTAVTKTVSGFEEAWNHHDMKAFGKLFTKDADFVNVAAKWDRGRTSIVKHHAWSHGAVSKSDSAGPMKYYGMFKNSTIAFDSIAVRFVRTDVAISHVMWRLTGDTRTAFARTGMLTFIVLNNNGIWQICSGQNTEINRTVH